MRRLQVTLLVIALQACCTCCLAQMEGHIAYTDKYDTISVDEIFRNERLYKKYLNCLTGEGKCTPDGKELKEHIPEALSNGCEKCTPRQKKGGMRVLRYIMERRPEDWAKLERIYDPDGAHRRRYSDVLKKGLKVDLDTNGTTLEPTALP